MPLYAYLIIAAALGIGMAAGSYIRQSINNGKIKNAQLTASKIVEDALKEGENIKRERILEAKDEIYNAKKDLDNEVKSRRGEVQALEKRLIRDKHIIIVSIAIRQSDPTKSTETQKSRWNNSS